MRNPNCTLCKLHQTADIVCQWGSGNLKAELVVVSKMPNSGEWHKELLIDLEEAGIDTSNVYFTQALRCRTFDQDASNPDIKACRPYLEEELEEINPKWVLALGNEALLATTGHSGIMKYRGKLYDKSSYSVLPTISPSSVKRNPGQRGGYLADLRLLANKMKGRDSGIAKPNWVIIDTKEKLALLKKVLSSTQELHWDVETHSDYFKADGRIVTLSGTCEVLDKNGKTKLWVFGLPLYHPESPWKSSHRSVLTYLKSSFEGIPRAVAHNGAYDSKWMIAYGINLKVTFDTLLAIHVLNENVQKGLKPQAQARLGVEPWGIDTKDLLTTPLDRVLEYNVLDTWYMYWVKKQLVEELKEKPRLARVLMKLLMPAQRDLIDSEMRGIWVDVPRLESRAPIVEQTLTDTRDKILTLADLQTEDNPLGLKPEDSAWPKDAKGKPREVNLNASIFARWLLFDWCGLPIYERGKEKANGAPGDPSMAEDVLLALKHSHPIVPAMLDRVKWQKYSSSFINPYRDLYDEEHRIHTNFKLAGTVTGRLSSGKTDEEKVTGNRGKLRGVNLQQVPRDPFIRGLFGAPPGWTFVEADYSQIELRIAAFLARERHMLHLYAVGADIHLTTAARVTGLPESQVSKEVRKRVGKPVNFGFLYGMGWKKFIETAFNNYGAVFSEEEARGARKTFFDLYPGLPAWHNRQRRLVNEHGRVQSPLGRVRHLPDIFSPEQGVRAEAERQAINSPVQGFASDLAVLSMVAINQKFRDLGINGHCLGLVHDAINFEIRNDDVPKALPIIKNTMEDMSLVRRKFGVHVDIPIIADLKTGSHWGDTKELTVDQVYDWKPEYSGN